MLANTLQVFLYEFGFTLPLVVVCLGYPSRRSGGWVNCHWSLLSTTSLEPPPPMNLIFSNLVTHWSHLRSPSIAGGTLALETLPKGGVYLYSSCCGHLWPNQGRSDQRAFFVLFPTLLVPCPKWNLSLVFLLIVFFLLLFNQRKWSEMKEATWCGG